MVDDELTLRMLISDILEENGYKILTAKNGASAPSHLRSEIAIELLITDVGLPGGMNGRQLAGETRKLSSDLKVLSITGLAENAAIGHGHLDPGMDVMTKPFEITILALDRSSRIADLHAYGMVAGGENGLVASLMSGIGP